jgi:hypothetical protein
MGIKGLLFGGILGHFIEEKLKKKTLKSENIEKKEGVERGDIISVSRGVYSHIGVYINNKEVIHYTSNDSDIGDNFIQSTSLKRFLRGTEKYSVLVFPSKYGEPTSVPFSAASGTLLYDFSKHFKNQNYTVYSPSETIRRAKSKLNEKQYNLASNNCEHFAIWCKTGISESHQVNNVIKFMLCPMHEFY